MKIRNPLYPADSKDVCVIIGNGPSLRGFDLHRLAGIPTLGMNAAYRFWDRIGWYPDHYACVDDQLILTHHAEIERLCVHGLVGSFIVHGTFFDFHPHRMSDPRFTAFEQTASYWYRQKGAAMGLEPLFEKPAYRMRDGSKITTGSTAVRYVADLGYRKLYLIGIDLRYVEIIPEAEPTEGTGLRIKQTPRHNPNYFFDSYQQTGDLYNIPNPSDHNGRLHADAFTDIRDDFAHFGVDCRVYTANRDSLLSDENIFPFQPLPIKADSAVERGLSSILVPCSVREVDDIIVNFRLWSLSGYLPSLPESPYGRPIFAILFNNASGLGASERIRAAFNDNGMGRFFARVAIDSLDLEGARDAYIRDYTQPVGDEGYKAGPNNLFFGSMRRVAAHGKYTFLMETDCLPIRQGWLDRLNHLVSSQDDAWIIGSAYRGQAKLDPGYKRHLNGNAIYAAGDADFQHFMETFWEPQTRRLIREKIKTLAYDCALDMLFTGDEMEVPGVYDIWKQVAHRFRYTDFIQNISANSDLERTDISIIQRLRRESPDTYILHNRVAHRLAVAASDDLVRPPVNGTPDTSRFPRLLVFDMTAAGNGTATGEIKANLLADWPPEALLQVAQGSSARLFLVRRDGAGFAATGADEAAVTAAIDTFDPQVILYRPVPDVRQLHDLAVRTMQQLDRPFFIWIMDDWPDRLAAEDPEQWGQLESDLTEVLRGATLRLSICEAMSAALARRYGLPFRPLANGIDPADWSPLRPHAAGPMRVRYAGGLAENMTRSSVLRIARAVEALAGGGTDVRFEINTQPWWHAQARHLFEGFAHTTIETVTRPAAAYRIWLAEADVLLIAYNFDPATLRYVQYSMANKMPECLVSGAAVLAHGPRGIATIDHLAATGAALVVPEDSDAAVTAALRDLAADPALRADLAGRGRRVALANHDIRRLRETLRDLLRHAADTPRAPVLVPASASPRDSALELTQLKAHFVALDGRAQMLDRARSEAAAILAGHAARMAQDLAERQALIAQMHSLLARPPQEAAPPVQARDPGGDGNGAADGDGNTGVSREDAA